MSLGKNVWKRISFLQSLVEEACHNLQCLLGFGQLEVIPECVWQGFKNHELRIDSGAKQRAMKDRSVAQKQVAGAGYQQAGRKAVKVGKQRREHGIFGISFAYVSFIVGAIRSLGGNISREAIQSKKLLRVGRAAEICERRKHSQSGGQRQAQKLDLDRNFAR